MLDTEAARARLLAKRAELEERVRRIDTDLHKREEPLSADFAEQVVEQENMDVLYALENEGRAELQKVERALLRIERGEYGTCARCGKDIGEPRLEAVPHADNCIHCAE
jgi:DnaK suppressor protein